MLGREFAVRKLTALTGDQGATETSLQCKLELQECTGRTFLNDDLRGGRKMAATPRTNKRRKFALWVTFICSLYNLQHWVSKQV